MISVFHTQGNGLREAELGEPGTLVRLVAPTESEIERTVRACAGLRAEDFDPLLDANEISRFEMRANYVLLVLNAPACKSRGPRAAGEHRTFPFVVMAFNDGTLVLASQVELDLLGRNRRDARKVLPEVKRQRYLREVLMATALSFQDYIRDIESERMELVRGLDGKARACDLEHLHGLETDLVYFETALRANVAMLGHALGSTQFSEGESDAESFADILIEFNQASTMASVHRELVVSTRTLFSDVSSSNLNDSMKVLTSITVLLAIPSVIAGFYGMNVEPSGMPFSEVWFGFEFVLALTAGVCLAAAVLLRRRRML